MKDISPILRSLGLVDSEVRTYLTALENGPSTALDLAKRTRLSRQATYGAIESLTRRGLMSSALRDKKRFYAAEHPERLLAYARRRETKIKDHIRELERALPELELAIGGERPMVRMYEGKEGVRALLQEGLGAKSHQIWEIADVRAMNNILSFDDVQPIRDALARSGAKVTAFYAADSLNPQRIPGERFMLPKSMGDFRSDIFVFGDKVGLVSFEGKQYSILIENRAIAKALIRLFELAYQCAHQFEKK